MHVAASFFFLISLFIHQEIKFCSLLITPWNGRNERGREMLSLVENLLEIIPTTSSVKSAALPCWFARNFFWKKKFDLKDTFFREIGVHLLWKQSRQMIMQSWVWLLNTYSFQSDLCVWFGTIPNFWKFSYLLGKGPSQPAPKFIGNLIAFILNLVRILMHGALGHEIN